MIRFIFSLFAVVLMIAAPANAQDIVIKNAYSYASAPTQKNGAVFMVIENTGAQDDAVLSARGDVAERIELHTHIMDGEKMMMREVERYDIPAGQSAELKPMGHHIMLMNLAAPLSAGEHFPLTLNFEHAVPIEVDVKIVNPGEHP
ncbi:MAG: copper chaperone PCu(A)C [Alphaproteobacteria bacterium]|nr:copper chaperone PCu(A)C [Alphaproteobacteria bacterium]